MMYLVELADVLRRAGLQVVERHGWKERGHGRMSGVASITLHHTAGPATGEAPSLNTVENGRPDLLGPLSHLVLGRSGCWYVVAAGKCWHTGLTFETWQANEYAIGIEAEATGLDPWPREQYESYVRGARALAAFYGVPHDRVVGHREVAKPKGRKADPNFDLPAFRAALAGITTQEDDMSWTDTVTNGYGARVQGIQVVNGIELRVADVQRKLDAQAEALDALVTKVDGIGAGVPVDLAAVSEVIAALVDAKLAARLAA